MTRARIAILVVALLAIAGAAVVFTLPSLAPAAGGVPTVRPERGDLEVRVFTRGELSAERSRSVSAPAIGGTLQIVHLPPAGTVVHTGDLVVAFDPAEQQYNLDQAKSQLDEANQEFAKLTADARVQADTDQLELLKARFGVRKAEIAVSGNEFEGSIKAQKNILALDVGRRLLAQVEQDVQTHAATGEAQRAVVTEKRQKALLAMQIAQHNIDSMRVTAPIDGLVVLLENRSAAGNFFFSGMTLPEYKNGDAAQPGSMIANIVDTSTIGLKANVSETDRGLVGNGAAASMRIEGIAGAAIPGTATGVSGLAASSFWDVAAERQFEASFRFTAPSPALRPGMTAAIEIRGERLKNVIHIPRQSLFERMGKPVVFVRQGDGFVPQPVKVTRLTESRAVVEGVSTDAEVALADPDRAPASTGSAPAAPSVGGLP